MKTLYLHLGMAKTGTKSIQHFMLHNRRVLNEKGYQFPNSPYTYPLVDSCRNAHFMLGHQYNEDGARDRNRERECLVGGMAEIYAQFEKYDNIVLSEEGLWRGHGNHKKLFPYLAKHARNHDYTIKIVVYLRRQDDYVMSLWNQYVKHPRSQEMLPFDEYLEKFQKNAPHVLSYASTLDGIAECFGKENIIVRRFDRNFWKNGSLADDFLDCIGIERTDEFEDLPREANTGLSANMAEIKRVINHDKTFSEYENYYFSSLARSLSEESSARYPSCMMSVQERRAMLEKYSEENARTAAEYIGDGHPLFSDEIKDLPKWEPDNRFMQDDIIRLYASAVTDLRRRDEEASAEIESLKREAAALKKEIAGLRETLQNEQRLFRSFKDKVKHPLHALFSKMS